MSDYTIITRAHIRAKARAAFDAGKPRNSHGFNPGAAAIFDFLEEYDRCAAQLSQLKAIQPRRVDLRQEMV